MKSPAKYYKDDIESLISFTAPKKIKKVIYTGQKIKGKYDYIFLPNTFAYTTDIQSTIQGLKKHLMPDARIVVIYFNFFWKPLLDLATKLNLRERQVQEPNWLSDTDIQNFFYLENFDLVKKGKRFLFPLEIGLLSSFINKFIAHLPIINSFCLTTYQIFRQLPSTKDYSVSIIIPARNEEGNMKGVIKKLPKMGKSTEIIFVEGHSKDNTYDAIKEEIRRHPKVKASVFKQKGKGKADAVRLGFDKAKNDILMILDADLTVDPSELPKFYNAISQGHTDFANGSRLVYPMESQAMRTLNYLGNTFFAYLFTYLMDQRVKDTLCGTKVLFRKDYLKIKSNRSFFGDFDPFGDFDLLFGATKLNLKIIDIPVRYKDRTYGSTNISRFRHGLLLIQMALFAAKKIKFI